jgi:AcrR family transcriptional regulator
MSNPPLPDTAREHLLQRAVDYMAERGIGDISLRELATAMGTSHRMLIYHFGSKEGVFVAVVREVERRQRLHLAQLIEQSTGSPADLLRAFWHGLRSSELAPLERLFFELYAGALQGRSYAVPILEDVVDSWIEPGLPVLVAEGFTEPEARAEARLGLAVIRGLLLDVLATGDTDGVDAAFERYLVGSEALRVRRQPADRGSERRI